MASENLLRYLNGVLQLELDLFVQKRTIDELKRQYNYLAISKRPSQPQKPKPEVSLLSCVIVSAIICGIISVLIELVMNWDEMSNFFYFIAGIIAVLIVGVINMIPGGIIVGLLSWMILRLLKKHSIAKKYKTDICKYESAIATYETRMKIENRKKDALAREITALQYSYNKTREQLSDAYSYNVIDPEYRSIYAVSSFLGYVRKGRTYGLKFDPETGDQGAYNLYENERRLDLIITNTDEILHRLDQVIHNQQELAMGLERATKQVTSLCNQVIGRLDKISDSVNAIERSQSIVAYNTEISRRNLEFMTWIHLYY